MDILSKIVLVSFNEDIFGDISFGQMVGYSACFGILCDCGQVTASQVLSCAKKVTTANRVVV